jgi:acyl-CoA thioesterase-2
MKNAQDLIDLIELEPIEENIFRGQSHKTSWNRVFGGQVLAQSLYAASQTVVDDRIPHSMHGYFILPGDINMPIVYKVDRLRDGGSFTTRRVTAIQKGQAIFNMAASFQEPQVGLDHQISMPNVPPPETLATDTELAEEFKDTMPLLYQSFQVPRPVEFRPVEKLDLLRPHSQNPFRHVWMKAKGDIPSQKRIHLEMLAYASDYNLLTTAILPHQDEISYLQLQLASLDHAMWFHREFRFDEWLLFATDSPSASNTRGFTRGSIFNRSGQLVASVAQEGLMRKRRPKKN